MWMWRAETGLWEKDPAAPIGFERNLMGIAFAADDPLRGYAVGKEGALLHYDKTWTQDPLPAGFENANFTSVAFAGKQALVAAGADVLVNDGADWHVDTDVRAPVRDPARRRSRGSRPSPACPTAARSPAGENFVIERDSLDRALALLDPAAARRHPDRARGVPRGRQRARAGRRPAAAALPDPGHAPRDLARTRRRR